jgi:hypothetical protein
MRSPEKRSPKLSLKTKLLLALGAISVLGVGYIADKRGDRGQILEYPTISVPQSASQSVDSSRFAPEAHQPSQTSEWTHLLDKTRYNCVTIGDAGVPNAYRAHLALGTPSVMYHLDWHNSAVVRGVNEATGLPYSAVRPRVTPYAPGNLPSLVHAGDQFCAAK